MKRPVEASNRWGERLRDESIAAVPTALVSTVTAVAFVQVFGTWDFLWPLLLTAVLVHVWGILVRSTDPPILVAFVSPTVSVVCVIGWQRFADTLWYGLPLSTTWSAMQSDLRSAWELVGDVVTPVGFASGFGTMAMFVIGFVAAVTDSFAARYGGRVEVFVPAAATLFIVATVGTGQDRLGISTLWLMIAILATALIRRERRRRESGNHKVAAAPRSASVRSAVGIVLLVATVGIVARTVAPLLPGAGEEAWLTQQARGGVRELQPLVDIRRQLNDPSATILFTVHSDTPAYWRVTGLANFDGSTWSISEEQLDSAGGTLTPPTGVEDPGVDTVDNFQRFTIEGLAGNMVPVAATPTRLRSSTQSLFYEPESGTLLMGADGVRPRDSYEMQSTMIAPRPERLLLATADSPPDAKYLDIPEGSPQIDSIAESIAPANLSPYERALALQDFFRTEFIYSLDVPPLSGSDATLAFLERRTGYCEHFASTFALFARTLGLPARVAIGFTPGERATSELGANQFIVRASHAHAWPEVWFDGLGWVLFEPTPGRGAPNSSYTNVPEEQNDEPVPTTTTPPTTSTTAVPTDDASTTPTIVPGTDTADLDPDRSDDRPIWPIVVIILTAFAAIIWFAVLPRLMREIIRRRNDPPSLVMWRRAIALYELERGSFEPSLSPLELASQATSRLYDDDEFIVELAQIASASLFGQQLPTSQEIESLDERCRAYLATRRRRLKWHHRIRARLDPIAMWKLEGGTKSK